ncbi:MAG TPA: DUF881 domain-containing protein [Clostridiaceae bacterium]|nr:DUF881 domain-containing protein [Clostridiaceae bacterium]
MKTGRNIAITIVCIILGIMLAWQYKSINFNQSIASTQNKRTEELMNELIKQQNTNAELRSRLQELNDLVKQYENARADDDEFTNTLKEQLEKARIYAGLTDVKGKGVIVTLDNNGFVDVIDNDILDVVNELRAGGAQAISVNDERITAMSEIRSAGNYIVINGRQMVAPFVIKAISDPRDLEKALMLIDGVIEKLQKYQLKVSVKRSDNIVIPKARDEVIKINLLTPVN